MRSMYFQKSLAFATGADRETPPLFYTYYRATGLALAKKIAFARGRPKDLLSLVSFVGNNNNWAAMGGGTKSIHTCAINKRNVVVVALQLPCYYTVLLAHA